MSALTDRLQYLVDLSVDSASCDMPCTIEEMEAAIKRINKLEVALNKLARLGNGARYGNSIGNNIAQIALEETDAG